MPDLSKITLPSGNTYDIKDATAREMISGGISFIVAWNGQGTPVASEIPAGVIIDLGDHAVVGTLPANDAVVGAFYLVKSNTAVGTLDLYDEYVPVGSAGSKTWEKIGDTQVDLSDIAKGVDLEGVPYYPDVNDGIVYITAQDILAAIANAGIEGKMDYLSVNGSSVSLVTKTGDPVSYSTFYGHAMTVAYQPYAIVQVVPSIFGIRVYNLVYTRPNSEVAPTAGVVTLQAIDNGIIYTVQLSSAGVGDGLTGTITTTGFGDVTDVTFTKQTDVVLGEATTFALTNGNITHGSLSGHTANVVTGYSPSTDTFVKSVSAETNKNLVTTTVPNITSVGSASTWTFTMGTGNDSETLIISGANGSAPSYGTAITVATGATSTTGQGDAVVTGVTIGSSAAAITALGTANTVAAVTSMPSSTVGTNITVGTNDKVTALTNATTMTVTKAN